MCGPVGEKNDSYPFLNRFSTRTLRQLLREDFVSPEPSTPESDTFITCVLEVIARRAEADPRAPQFDVDAGWRDFQKHYCPPDTDAAPAGDEALPDAAAGALEADISRMAAQWTRLQGEDRAESPGTSESHP